MRAPSKHSAFAKRGIAINASKSEISDSGRRRHLSWGMDFDSRCLTLTQEIGEDWDDHVKEMWLSNKEKAREGLVAEFGAIHAELKIENFVAIGTKPFSTMSHHNRFFHQVRQSFVIGSYYPALVGACALGERMLNHLVIDLRGFFQSSSAYKIIYRKDSFDNWDIPIKVLEEWGVLLPETLKEFRALKTLRHRSIHFNDSTYRTIKQDALSAIMHMRTIIEKQFGSHGLHPWFIKGTKGHLFISREYETDPFVQTYYIPNCPFVGPLFSMEPTADGWQFIDYPDYGGGEWTDDEFAREYEARDPTALAKRSQPAGAM